MLARNPRASKLFDAAPPQPNGKSTTEGRRHGAFAPRRALSVRPFLRVLRAAESVVSRAEVQLAAGDAKGARALVADALRRGVVFGPRQLAARDALRLRQSAGAEA